MKKVVDSIKESDEIVSILILDNGSTQASFSLLSNLQAKNKNIDLITSKDNLGFEGGVNFAYTYLQRKRGSTLKYIFLLNPDAIIQKNMISNLYHILLKNKNVAAISPKIFDARKQLQYAGWTINWKNCSIQIDKKETDIFKTDVFHGCAVLIDAKKFMEVGMFDDKIFMYYDEAFLSMKFQKHSYDILCAPQYEVIHQSSFSLGAASMLKSYYHTRNHLYFFKTYSLNSNPLCKYSFILKNILSSLKHFRYHNFVGILRGIYDFKRHKLGKIDI